MSSRRLSNVDEMVRAALAEESLLLTEKGVGGRRTSLTAPSFAALLPWREAFPTHMPLSGLWLEMTA